MSEEQTTTLNTRTSPRRNKPELIVQNEETGSINKQEDAKSSINVEHSLTAKNDTNGSAEKQQINETGNLKKESDHLEDVGKNIDSEKDVVEGHKTPPSMPSSPPPTADSFTRASTRKRRSAATAILGNQDNKEANNSPSVKRRNSRGTNAKNSKKTNPPVLNLDEDDPYNFSLNSNVHPEPLSNINSPFQIERSSFGEIRFTKSVQGSAERYANVEKIAAGRNPVLAASLSSPMLSTSQDHPTSLAMLSSSSSLRLELELTTNDDAANTTRNSTRSKSRSATRTKSANNRSMRANDESLLETPADQGLNTPASGRKSRFSTASKKTSPYSPNVANEVLKTPQSTRKSEYWPAAVVKTDKRVNNELYKVPKLSVEEQFAVDHPEDISHFLHPGTRVLALWGNEYYSANICGREALGRYYVHFVEDNLNRVLPPSGVIPISFLKPGTRLSFIDIVDNDEIGKLSEVVSLPSEKDLNEWVRGYFKVREFDDDSNPTEDILDISWSKIYLSKEQASQILHGKTFNPVQKIDRENIVNESRSSRRSRRTSSLGNGDFDVYLLQTNPKDSQESRTDQMNKLSLSTPKQNNNDIPTTKSSSPESNKSLEATNNQETTNQMDAVKELNIKIFGGLKFVLTSATRPNKVTEFNKREYRAKIEERSGHVVEDFSSLNADEQAYLIADTYYRTHKYLSALSLSVPCVNFKWIQECVNENKLIDYKEYLLPAGESSLDSNQIFEWKPLKDKLLKGKSAIIYSNLFEEPKAIQFADIWGPLLKNLGAKIVGRTIGEPFANGTEQTASLEEKIQFIEKYDFDIFLTDIGCEQGLAEAVRGKGIYAVCSEWVIQAIVTGELPDMTNERFHYNYGP